jgi:hypothetical protein
MGLKVYSLIILCEHHILGMQMDTSNAYILHNSTTSFILFFFLNLKEYCNLYIYSLRPQISIVGEQTR